MRINKKNDIDDKMAEKGEAGGDFDFPRVGRLQWAIRDVCHLFLMYSKCDKATGW